jgi:ABC-2 type transport system ATP-binding protein
MTAVVQTESLTKVYRSTSGLIRGLTDLTMSVRAGEVFGFLGPNGAGKTTLIRLLLDFIRPTSGQARLFGLDCRRDAVAIHRRVGYIPGELSLYESMTGREHVDYLAGLSGPVNARRVAELASRFELDLSQPIRTLSKGNKQKVGIVQAFAGDPELLVLDEPTSGLDPLMQLEFHRLLRDTVNDGRTVLLSSHQLDEVQRVADRVAIIREGALVVVDDVGVLRAKAVRRVDIHFAHLVDAAAFRGVEGVVSVDATGDRVTLGVEGSLDAVIKAAARFEVVDLVTREGDLDDVFLGYYASGPR